MRGIAGWATVRLCLASRFLSLFVVEVNYALQTCSINLKHNNANVFECWHLYNTCSIFDKFNAVASWTHLLGPFSLRYVVWAVIHSGLDSGPPCTCSDCDLFCRFVYLITSYNCLTIISYNCKICVVLCKDISLQRGRFCARSLASCIPRSSEDRSSQNVLYPGCARPPR